MRMWLVDPKNLCSRHLLGEHVEMHMFVGTIKKGRKIDGYIKNGLVDTDKIKKRHDDLAEEMIRRGFNHASELLYEDCLNLQSVNVIQNEISLKMRCKKCFQNKE